MEGFIINNKKIMKVLRIAVISANVILMVVTVVLQLWGFEVLKNAILCSCILLLIAVTLFFYGILKDYREMIAYGVWYAFWLSNLIMSLF